METVKMFEGKINLPPENKQYSMFELFGSHQIAKKKMFYQRKLLNEFVFSLDFISTGFIDWC